MYVCVCICVCVCVCVCVCEGRMHMGDDDPLLLSTHTFHSTSPLFTSPPDANPTHCISVQENTPAGTIFGEDIEEVCEDFEESMKDSAKVKRCRLPVVFSPLYFNHVHEYSSPPFTSSLLHPPPHLTLFLLH